MRYRELRLPSGGTRRRYEPAGSEFIMIDDYGDESVVSWSSDVSASSFIDLCAHGGGFTDETEAILSVGGQRFRGSGKAAAPWVADFKASDIDASCDFARFDLRAMTLAFHSFERRKVISAVCKSTELELAWNFADGTATNKVRKYLPEISKRQACSVP